MRLISIIIVISVFCIIPTPHILAQDIQWSKGYGDVNEDWGWSVIETIDSGLLIAGFSSSFTPGNTDAWILRCDQGGDTLWTRVFGGEGYDRAYSVDKALDGGFIIAGHTESFGLSDYDFYLIRISETGDSLWAKTYGGTDNQTAISVIQVSDGGFMCLGSTGTNGFMLLKTNSNGDSLWAKTYGSNGQGNDIHETADGGFILVGYESNGSSKKTVLLKTDYLGNTEWVNDAWPDGCDPRSLQITPDGGYIITGYHEPPRYSTFLFRANSFGDSLWTKFYQASSGQEVILSSDNGYLIGGFDYINDQAAGASLRRVDSLGNELWHENFGGWSTYGWCKTWDNFFVGTGITGTNGNDVHLLKIGTLRVVEFQIDNTDISQNIINHQPVISWVYFDPLLNPQTTFELAVSTDDDWAYAEMWNPAPFDSPDTFITYAGLPLIDGETYYLRLRVNNSLAWSEWYETSFRMNSVPTIPFPTFPMDGSIAYSLSPTLSIFNSSDAEGDDLFYDFMIEVDCVLVGEANIPQQIDSTDWTSEPLPYDNFLYLWTARAFDGYEYSDWADQFSFWTNAVEEWPYPFELTYPPDTGWSQVYDFPAPFVWHPSFDPDPFDSVRYKLHISIDDAFLFEAIIDSVYDLTYPVGGLQYGTHYWWKVEAIDTRGNSTTSSGVADFMTWVLGDANADRSANVGDAVFLINYVFKGGPAPDPIKIGDANGDCSTNVGDAVYLINFVFKGGDDPQVGCTPPTTKYGK